MSTFGQLQGSNIVLEAREYSLDELPGEPVLMIKHAGEKNKPYFNAMLKSMPVDEIKKIQKGTISASMTAKQRDSDRAIYPGTVLVGWSNITDVDGNEIPFSVEKATEFLQQIPEYLFDDIRAFATNPRKFTQAAIDAEAAAKN